MKKLAFIVVAVFVLAGCSASPESVIQNVWGKPGPDNGPAVFSYKNGALTVNYNYRQWNDASIYQNELGQRVDSYIRRTFEKIKEITSITVVGYAPLLIDNLGNYKWVPRAEFTITRALYEKINWDNFDPLTLFNVCGGKMLR